MIYDLKAETKKRIDLVTLIGETVTLTKTGRNYQGFCPFHPNTNTPALAVFPETQTWHCFGGCGEGGDIFTWLMKRDGLDFKQALENLTARAGLNGNGYHPATTKRSYTGLADYAQAHGVAADVFKSAGWAQTTHSNRPALIFKTNTGPRYRYFDGNSPPYWHKAGYRRCWYKLAEAAALAQQTGQPLVITNGEASTIVAQSFGLAAVAIAGGSEKPTIPDHLLTELQTVYTGPVVVALDCDQAGRGAAPKLAHFLTQAGYSARAVDLALGDEGQDLADFCALHQAQAAARLLALNEIAPPQTPPTDPPHPTELGYYSITQAGHTLYHAPPRQTQNGIITPHPDVVADFWARLVDKRVIYDENERAVIFTVRGEKNGRPFTAKLPGDIWFDKVKLATVLLPHLPGKPPVIDPKKLSHWGPAFSYLGEDHESRALASTGWTFDGQCFVAPAGSIGSGWDCELDDTLAAALSGFGFPQGEGTDSTAQAAARALFALAEIYHPPTVYITLAHAFLAPVLRWVAELRYLLHIQANSSYGKTELAKFIMALYGVTGDQAITYKWSDTPIGFESRAYALKDMLVLVDDYKPGFFQRGSGDEKGWIRNLQAYTSGSGRGRAQKDGKAGKLRPPRCLLLSTGEDDLRFDEESIINRTLTVRLGKPDPANLTRYHELKEMAAALPTVMARYIAWLMARRPPARDLHRQFLNEHKTALNSHLARNMASNKVGAALLTQFLQDTGLLPPETIEQFKTAHALALAAAAQDTADTAREQRYSHIFLDALGASVSSRVAYIEPPTSDRPGRVGWGDDAYLYLTAAAVKVANDWLRSTGREIKISPASLYSQLYEDGYLCPPDKYLQTKTGPLQRSARNLAGKTEKVITLYRSKIGDYFSL